LSVVDRPGTRGATSAEYFLKAGYAVIFMHRQFSLQPFSRHYSHSTNPFLDFLEIETDLDPPKITVTPSKYDELLEVLTAYKSVQQAGLLHTLTFVTVDEYLWLLRAVSQELSVLGRSALYYLAAAVSDFYLPRQKMVRLYYFLTAGYLLSVLVYSRNTRFNPGKEAC
jgi:phosphopantothenate-cysteine ligase